MSSHDQDRTGTSVLCCDGCFEASVVVFCGECRKFFCVTCQGNHNSLKRFFEHRCVNIEEMRFCTLHPREQLTDFCDDCNQSLCISCIIQTHKAHHTTLLEDAVTQTKEELLRWSHDLEFELEHSERREKVLSDLNRQIECSRNHFKRILQHMKNLNESIRLVFPHYFEKLVEAKNQWQYIINQDKQAQLKGRQIEEYLSSDLNNKLGIVKAFLVEQKTKIVRKVPIEPNRQRPPLIETDRLLSEVSQSFDKYLNGLSGQKRDTTKKDNVGSSEKDNHISPPATDVYSFRSATSPSKTVTGDLEPNSSQFATNGMPVSPKKSRIVMRIKHGQVSHHAERGDSDKPKSVSNGPKKGTVPVSLKRKRLDNSPTKNVLCDNVLTGNIVGQKRLSASASDHDYSMITERSDA